MLNINTLSIRSYSRQTHGHVHEFHQLVLPVAGVISIEVSGFKGKVRPGECVIVVAGEMHYFASETQARFVVADLRELPKPLLDATNPVFSVSEPLFSFLNFIDTQLSYQIQPNIEGLMFNTFYALLQEQRMTKEVEGRVRKALEYIDTNLNQSLTIEVLARVACLSPTQFKKLFKQQTNQSVANYITLQRMDKARALLIHTDYPIPIVAESVGYNDATAFSRRFSQHFGLSPSKVTR